jgi:hypothetical protein
MAMPVWVVIEGWGTKEEVSRSEPLSTGGSCAVGWRQRRRPLRQSNGALLRRLTRSHRAQLDGNEVVPTGTAGGAAG